MPRARRHEMTFGTRRLFIYYRVHAAQLADALAAAARLQSLLCASHPGLRAELLRRPDVEDSHVTLMETYTMDAAVAPHGVDAGLQAAIDTEARTLLGHWVAGVRHVEVFDTCAS